MEFLIRLLRLILPHITPEIRDAIKDLLETLAERAKRSQNPWDDIFIEILQEGRSRLILNGLSMLEWPSTGRL